MGERLFQGENLTRHSADMVRKLLGINSLSHATFDKTNLRRADFGREDLSHASFCDSSLRSANFRKANLSHADFTNADVRWANFQGANMASAKNLTARMLAQAYIDDDTILPTGITRDDIAKGVLVREKDKEPRRKDLRGARGKSRRSGIIDRRAKDRDQEWL